MGEDRKLRVGVAGLGRAFTVMLPTFAADPRVMLIAAAVCRRLPSPGRARRPIPPRRTSPVAAEGPDPTGSRSRVPGACDVAWAGWLVRPRRPAAARRVRQRDRSGWRSRCCWPRPSRCWSRLLCSCPRPDRPRRPGRGLSPPSRRRHSSWWRNSGCPRLVLLWRRRPSTWPRRRRAMRLTWRSNGRYRTCARAEQFPSPST